MSTERGCRLLAEHPPSVGDGIWIRVADAMEADPLHQLNILPPMGRKAAHRVVAGGMDDAVIAGHSSEAAAFVLAVHPHDLAGAGDVLLQVFQGHAALDERLAHPSPLGC